MFIDPEKQLLLDCFVQHRDRLRTVAKRALFGSEWVDDVIHDAYLRVLSSPTTEARVRHPLSYCVRVVQNVALDHCRRRLREESQIESAVDLEGLAAHDRQPLPDSVFRRTQHMQRVERKLAAMQPRLRQAFVLKYFHGRSQREIAASMNCALGSVGTMIAQALQALGIRMGPGSGMYLEAEDSR